MNCPKCGSINRKVVNTRAVHGKNEVRRRYKCLDCDARFTTYELTIVDLAKLSKR